ncbi:MAG: thioesterase family protein [Clostridia bacterium]|nr:thioesterase family protein [Clostridia bacterium]MBQ9847799.1 thioesterase family protein [Clostridia bacterium]
MDNMTATVNETVTPEKTAASVGSGSLPVYATPAMLALIEKAACVAVSPLLSEGETSVGTYLAVKHLAATPVGMNVSATAKLIERDGRKLVFNVTASDECGVIGEGTHERFIVLSERFTEKTNAKLNK